MTDTAKKAVPSFSLDAFEASDTGKMQVLDAAGNPTGWFWEFAGPGHPKTEALNNRLARERLHKSAQIEQSQVNGRKWKAEEEIPDAVRAKNIADLVARIVGWSEVIIGDKPFPFSPENAIEFLSHPKRVGVLTQAMEFLAAEKSFSPRSE
ncbi:hypothetical protein [Devosia ginsengisoli]|uniref:Uncharacterized protein n=1 Tax=Devosia ginsengisoli TaxID=400770 RepID=A0A5B8LQJ4_9HYPH|nr:hypothetical protein [Devosia ginsengisoli]QDZ10518.1 hypothetical protein FPZ08_07000 [Devosia ginsengisoli]